jgi:outer membrane protein assembly factor BamB
MALGLPAPAVEGDMVVAGFGSGELVAIRAGDGRALWSETLSSARGGGISDIAAIAAMPVIDRGRVFAAGLGGLAIAIDLRSGRRLWEREVTSAEMPWSAGGAVFLITTDGDLACIDREDGRVRWVRALGRFRDEAKRRDPITWGGPVLAGGRLLVTGSHGRMAQVDPGDGEVILTSRLPAGVTLPPAIAEGMLYLLAHDATLVALRGHDLPSG